MDMSCCVAFFSGAPGAGSCDDDIDDEDGNDEDGDDEDGDDEDGDDDGPDDRDAPLDNKATAFVCNGRSNG